MTDIDTGTPPDRMQESLLRREADGLHAVHADISPVADMAVCRHQPQDGADHLPQPRVSAEIARGLPPRRTPAGYPLHAASTSATVFGIGGPSTRLPDFVTSTSSSIR